MRLISILFLLTLKAPPSDIDEEEAFVDMVRYMWNVVIEVAATR